MKTRPYDACKCQKGMCECRVRVVRILPEAYHQVSEPQPQRLQ